jgi:peptidoglycan/LPS O-acetylase OafA/YrhL
VLLVIGNHAHVAGFGGGYAGVDVFFVISGYVITQRLLRDTGTSVRRGLIDFYSRRVRRIVPAASATLVGTLVAAGVFLGSQFDPALLGDVRWSALFGANARLISTGSDYFVPGTAPSLVTQFWSLAVEEQFYFVFPLLVFLTTRVTRRRNRLQLLMFSLMPLVAASAWWSAQSSATEPAVAYYSPFTRFWELGVGCLLAVAMTRRTHSGMRWQPLAALLGVAGLALTMAVLPGAIDYPGTLAWLPVASAALLLAGQSPLHTRLLSARPLTWIGDRSYSLYLWHWVWLQLPAQLAAPLVGPGWRLLELAGTAVTATLTYRWLENPVRRSHRLATDPVAAGLLLAVCLIGVCTATLLAARFTPSAG